MYITRKERNACLDASDFISTHADGADDYAPFEEMQTLLMSIFHKAKKEHERRGSKRLVKKYLKEVGKLKE